jgi:hypothetical protein
MFSFKSKLIDDTLKVKGNYSMKRISVAVTFPNTLALGWYIVLSDRWLGDKVVNIYAIQVFDSLLIFCTAGLSLIIAGALKQKFLNDGTTTQSTENIERIERTESSTNSNQE